MNVWEAGLSDPLMKFLRNPNDLRAIERMYECYSQDPNIVKSIEKKVFTDVRFKSLYDKWYQPEPFTLDELVSLPKDTLGYMYASHMKKNNLEVNFISPFRGKDILSYLWLRAGHVHDISHVITGYDTS